MLQLTAASPLLGLLALACVSDLRERRIPNAIAFGGALIGLLVQFHLTGAAGLGLAAAGWLTGLACFVPLYAIRAMAAGDVKLMAMAGAFLGPIAALQAAAVTLVAGGLIGGLFYAAQRVRSLLPTAQDSGAVLSMCESSRYNKVPYALAITIGAALVALR